MSFTESAARQRQRDKEYLAACKAHGIEADLPDYLSSAISGDSLDLIDSDNRGDRNGFSYRTELHEPEPLQPLGAAAAAAEKILDALLPRSQRDPASFVRAAGRRCLALAWLLGRRKESLAEMARSMNMSRASLSSHVRKIEDRCGLHGRGQKRAGTRSTYKVTAKEGWKLRRLNSAFDAAAVVDE